MTQLQKKLIFGFAGIGAIVIALLAAYFVYNAASNSTKTGNLGRHKMGALTALEFPKQETIAPNTVFLDKDGKQRMLSEFKGSILVVNLWATWCPPCVREMPSLAKLSEFYKGQNLKIIAISVDKADDTNKAKTKLMELTKGKIDFYQDPEMKIPFAMSAAGFPTTIIYDENLKEIARLPGDADWDSPEAQSLFDDILKNPKN